MQIYALPIFSVRISNLLNTVRRNTSLTFSQLTTLAYGMVFDGSVKWSPAINLAFWVNSILMLKIRWHQLSSKPTVHHYTYLKLTCYFSIYILWILHPPSVCFHFFRPAVKHAWYYRAPLFETSDCSCGRVLWLWICFSYISSRRLKPTYSANMISSVLFNRSKGTNDVVSSLHLILISHPFVIT